MLDKSAAILGFGELGRSWAVSLQRSGMTDVRVYARQRNGSEQAAALAKAARETGVTLSTTPQQAAWDAAWIVAAVPASATLEVAAQVATVELTGCFYVDVASAAPDKKVQACRLIEKAGGRYVDAAVMGSVVNGGLAVPVYVSGSEAEQWADLVAPLGMNVTVIPGPVGLAAELKLIRSVYLKGRDALIVEMLLAARRAGLLNQVLESIGGPGEEVRFDVLAERLACGVIAHAERRAEELTSAIDLMNHQLGVPPMVTLGALRRLSWVVERSSAMKLDEQRPRNLEEALEAIDPSSD